MGRAFEVRKAAMMKTGLAKTKIYTRHSKEIYLAAKAGGIEVEGNPTLKRAIERAKKDNVPADVIKRAIDKVASGSGEDYKANRYEGFGPNGSTIIVDCLTDNANRTISEVKNCFTKTDNKLGVAGSVSHLYEYEGIIGITGSDEESLMDFLVENDIDAKDLEVEDEIINVYIDGTMYMKSLEIIKNNFQVEFEELTWSSQVEVELNDEDKEIFEKLLSMLNECDDVQNIFHNVVNL